MPHSLLLLLPPLPPPPLPPLPLLPLLRMGTQAPPEAQSALVQHVGAGDAVAWSA